jgi:hypothetical protein
MGLRVDVGKYGSNLLPLKSVRRSDERKRRHDHFAGQIQSADGNFQGRGGITGDNAMLGPEEFANLGLELMDQWALIG